MTLLFNRDWRVQVGEVLVEKPLRVAFEVERTTRPQPNTATIRIYNLARSTRNRLQQEERATVSLEAGFDGDTSQIFQGQVVRARANQTRPSRVERDALDIVSIVEAADSGQEYREARVSRSYEPGVSITRVLRDCASALGVGAGNVREVEALAALSGGETTYTAGTVLSGQTSRELTRILASYGLRWSVQHGALQVQRRGEPLQSQAVRLSSATGLVGSPEVGTQGRVKATALLTPDLWPGRRVVLDSQLVEGQFLVDSIKYDGDSHGDAWYAHLQLRREETS